MIEFLKYFTIGLLSATLFTMIIVVGGAVGVVLLDMIWGFIR